jgi:hypothetical protein
MASAPPLIAWANQNQISTTVFSLKLYPYINFEYKMERFKEANILSFEVDNVKIENDTDET